MAVHSSPSRLEEPAGPRDRRISRALLAIIAVVVGAAALKVSAAISLPFVFAIFLVAIFWPVYAFLVRYIPKGLAAVATLFCLFGVIGIIGLGLGYSANLIGEKVPTYAPELRERADAARAWAEARHLPVPTLEGAELQKRLVENSRRFVDFLAASVLVFAFFVLGLLEVRDYKARLRGKATGSGRSWRDVAYDVSREFQRYIAVRTAIGVMTGVAVWIGSVLIGLEFAFVWGLTNFLLNYIPTLGSIVAVVPPVLFALVQYDNLQMALVALAVVGGVQLVMGYYVDPLLQGHYLKLSPVVVLLSVLLWGYIWGIAGAFIGVPITTFVVIVCRHFERTRWIAAMLAAVDSDAQPARPSAQPSASRASTI